jgi:hypothetical protein
MEAADMEDFDHNFEMEEFIMPFRMELNGPSCPECGGPMKEMNRRWEDEGILIWLQCERIECHGRRISMKFWNLAPTVDYLGIYPSG